MSASARPYIAVIGASNASDEDERDAEAVGERLARAGATVVTGGRGGVMAAASRGARSQGGTVVGILPGLDRAEANEWVDVAIATGLGELRNGLVVRGADAVIAVGGSYGTLSEIALALRDGLDVFGLHTWEIHGITVMATPEEAVRGALSAAAGARGRRSAT